MTFSKSDMLDRIEEIERDYYELQGHLFVRECIERYNQKQLPNIKQYDTTAIEFLQEDNMDYIRQKVNDIQVNMRVVHRNTAEILHRMSKNKTIRLVNYRNNPRYFDSK